MWEENVVIIFGKDIRKTKDKVLFLLYLIGMRIF
jgi:hypothetical protein